MHSPTARRGLYRYARYQRRLTIAIGLSLLAHAFILSLQFGLPGLGLPSLELPWNRRRAQSVGLSVVLANMKRAAEAASTAEIERQPEPETSIEHAQQLEPVPAQRSAPQTSAQPAPSDIPDRQPQSAPVENSDHASVPPGAATPVAPPPAGSGPRIIARNDMGQGGFTVPPPAPDERDRTMMPNADVRPESEDRMLSDKAVLPKPEDRAALELEQARAAQQLAEEEAVRQAREAKAQADQLLAQEIAARRQAEALALQARQKREDEENARREQELAAKKREEQQRQEVAQQQAAQQRAIDLALQKQAELQRQEEEKARRALELEARKREELRLQEEAVAQREAMERKARRQAEEEAQQQAVLRQKQAQEIAAKEKAEADAAAAASRQREHALVEKKQAAETAGIPRNALNGGLASRALEQARNIVSLPDAPPLPHQPLQAANPSRRRSILGRVDQDVGLMMYVESWRLKIERNGRLNYKQSLVENAYTEPIVTVAVRSDGSIEDIVLNRSSGRPELDEAVRRIIRINARYATFPPELARRYDVIEIRHVWNFGETLRLVEEMR